jgi:hypothetical protein
MVMRNILDPRFDFPPLSPYVPLHTYHCSLPLSPAPCPLPLPGPRGSGTIEEKIYHRQIFKHLLSKRILTDPRQSQMLSAKNLRDLFTLSEQSEGALRLVLSFSHNHHKHNHKHKHDHRKPSIT